MFKKYFNLEKAHGLTDVFVVIKYNNFLENEKIFMPVDNTNAIGHSSVDIVTNNFVFFGKQIQHIATVNFILECSIDKTLSAFNTVVPIPLKHILKNKYEKYMSDLIKTHSNCYLEIFQRYKKYEK
jgi:hypothetical protein